MALDSGKLFRLSESIIRFSSITIVSEPGIIGIWGRIIFCPMRWSSAFLTVVLLLFLATRSQEHSQLSPWDTRIPLQTCKRPPRKVVMLPAKSRCIKWIIIMPLQVGKIFLALWGKQRGSLIPARSIGAAVQSKLLHLNIPPLTLQ